MRPEILLLAFLLGCAPQGGQGTDTGNALHADLLVGGEGQALSGAREVGAVTVARMNLDMVELKACDATDRDELEYPGPYAVDLLDPQPLSAVDLAYDRVCELELQVGPAPENGDLLDGLGLYLEGRSTSGQNFSLTSSRRWEFEISEDVPLTESLTHFVVLFDLDAWFAGVDPDEGVADNGVVVIDDATNTDLLDLFEANIAGSARVEVEN